MKTSYRMLGGIVPVLPPVLIVFLELAAIGAVIASCLVWASRSGFRRLWLIVLSATVVACSVALIVEPIELYSYYCGRLCGFGVELSPFGIAISLVATGAAISPAAVRKRRKLQTVLSWVTATLSLIPGLSSWIA
jgi:hypothetical protein